MSIPTPIGGAGPSWGRRVWRGQWGQIYPFDKPLAGPKALQNDRSRRWCRVVTLTRFPFLGPSGYWAEMLGWGARRGSGGGSPAEARRRRGGTLLTSRGVGGVDDSLSSSHPCAPAPLREASPNG